MEFYISILGYKVEILTNWLKERCKNREKFFNYFGINCVFYRNDSNKNLCRNKEIMIECYKSDIVYGDIFVLLESSEFMGKKGKDNRPFEYIFIDEDDNICKDKLNNIVELIDKFPGFKYLEYLYLFTKHSKRNWINLKEFKGNFEKKLKKAELILYHQSI